MTLYEYLAVELKEFIDFEKAKEKIMFRLVPYSNELIADGIVHRRFINMAVTYYYMFSSETEMIPLTKSHIDRWKTRESDIYELAMENTPKKLSAVLESARDYILNTLVECINEESIITKTSLNNLIMDLLDCTLKDNDSDTIWENGSYNIEKLKEIIMERAAGRKNMYILSTRQRIHGAACMLYPKCLKETAEQIGSDLYIIPASIHELVLLPVNRSTKIKELKKDTLRASNEAIAPENRLTSDIYIYKRNKDTITIA